MFASGWILGGPIYSYVHRKTQALLPLSFLILFGSVVCMRIVVERRQEGEAENTASVHKRGGKVRWAHINKSQYRLLSDPQPLIQ